MYQDLCFILFIYSVNLLSQFLDLYIKVIIIIIIIIIIHEIWENIGYKSTSIYFLCLNHVLCSVGVWFHIMVDFSKLSYISSRPWSLKKIFSTLFIRFNIVWICLWVHWRFLLFSSICFHLPPASVPQFPCKHLQLLVSAFREPSDFLSWYWPHLHGTWTLVLSSPSPYLTWDGGIM